MPLRRVSRGFTFLEMLIVVGIIGILAAMGSIGYTSQFIKARDSRRKTDASTIKKILEEYEKDYSCYPQSSDSPVCGGTVGTIFENYIGIVPCDPDGSTSYTYEVEVGVCPSWYILYVDLENDNDFDSEKLGCSFGGCGPGGGSGFDFFVASPNAPIP